MNAKGMACIHYQSDFNEWMECLVYVPEGLATAALAAVRKGVEMFEEESNQEPYGQCIELALAAADIPYLIEYCEYDEYTDEPYPSWTAHVCEVTACKGLKVVEYDGEVLVVDGDRYFQIGETRREAYRNYIEREGEGEGYLKLTFKEFCSELEKGALSDYLEIARLHETPDGKVWCAEEYYG